MKIRHLMAVAVVALCATAMSNAASAAPMTFTGTLNWDGVPDTTPYSNDGSVSTFSFVVDNALPNTSDSADATISNFSYTLDGKSVSFAATPTVTFFSSSSNGGFDFNIGDLNNNVQTVTIFGPNVGNVDNGWIIAPGTFNITAGLNDGPATANTLNDVNTLQISGVPLPPALPMFATALLGLAGAGLAGRSRRAV